jgi:hypothetical protein
VKERHHGHREEIDGEGLLDDVQSDSKLPGDRREGGEVGVRRERSQHRKTEQDNYEVWIFISACGRSTGRLDVTSKRMLGDSGLTAA